MMLLRRVLVRVLALSLMLMVSGSYLGVDAALMYGVSGAQLAAEAAASLRHHEHHGVFSGVDEGTDLRETLRSAWTSLETDETFVGNNSDYQLCLQDVKEVLKSTYRDNPALCEKMIFSSTSSDINGYDLCLNQTWAHPCTVEANELPFSKPWVLCMPLSCNPASVVELLDNKLKNTKLKIFTWSAHCGTNSFPVDVSSEASAYGGLVTWIVVMFLWVMVCVAATALDLYWQSQQPEGSDAEPFATPRDAGSTVGLHSVTVQDSSKPLLDNEYEPPRSDSALTRATPAIVRENKSARDSRRAVAKLVEVCSLRKNCLELFESSPGRKYKVLDGIRSFSMVWIIFAHTLDFMSTAGFENMPVKFLFPNYFILFVMGGQFAVDSFFALSGFLSSHIMYRKLEKGAKIPIGMVVVLRYLRLIPLVAWFMAGLVMITPFMGDGPIWYKYLDFVDPCYHYWWSTLLFVNNFVPADFHQQCLPWTWYLSNDFQFSILGVFLLVGYFSRKTLTLVVCFALCVGCGIANYTITTEYDINLLDDNNQNMIYDKPYTRVLPYVFGVLLCFLFNDFREKCNPAHWSRTKRTLLALVSIGILIACICANHTNLKNLGSWNTEQSAFYNTFVHLGWSLALCIILYLCLCDSGGVINWILSQPIFEPMGKLTYAAYLLHPILMRIIYYNTRQLYYYDRLHVTYLVYFCFFVLTTYLMAIPIYVFIEMPFANMVGLFLKKKGK